MAFYKTSLENVGKILGYPKGKLPPEVKEINELKEYLERDTEIVLKAILTLKETLKTLGFKPRKLLTAGQLAMTCFRTYTRKNYTEKYYTEYNEEKRIRQIVKTKYAKEIREAYRGGDNQAHKIGKYENVTLIDINGLYADIMRKMEFPDLKSENKQEKPTIGMLKKYTPIKGIICAIAAQVMMMIPIANVMLLKKLAEEEAFDFWEGAFYQTQETPVKTKKGK